ncbi:hypothetical protein QTO30_07785 [Yoonia sp. GPGPB17]|uniref:hypothetical protein n=1 Tax=Yoonia sp. GPGPB17 TaxID=3026147 RepID=UPI0030BD3B7B
MSNDAELMMRTLTRRLAGTSLQPEQIEPLRDALMASPFEVTGIEICEKGICIDHLWKGGVDTLDLTSLMDDRLGDLLGCEVFPLGTIKPDLARLRSQHAF